MGANGSLYTVQACFCMVLSRRMMHHVNERLTYQKISINLGLFLTNRVCTL